MREFPNCVVPYAINVNGHNDADPGNEFRAVRLAAESWNLVGARIWLEARPNTAAAVATIDDENILVWDNGGPVPCGGWGPAPSAIIAMTVLWTRGNAQIFESDIVFNDRDYQWNTERQNLLDVQTANAAPFAITNGQTLTVSVDGDVPQEVTFAGVTEGAATAAQVGQNILDQVAGVWVFVVGGNRVRIQSQRTDGDGTIWTVGGTALPALNFPGPPARTTRLVDVQSIAVHELGHLLGLHHSVSPGPPGGPIMTAGAEPAALKRRMAAEDAQALNFLYSPDLGDAPDPFLLVLPPTLNQYPSLVHNPPPAPFPPPAPRRPLNGWDLYWPLAGPDHLFGYRGTRPFAGDRFEWLGDDMDDSPFECESLQVNLDLFDDGVVVNPPGRPLSPLAPNSIVVTIRHTAQAGRYVAGDPLRRLYLNGYADWAPVDGIFADPAERVIWWEGVPGATITASPTFRAMLPGAGGVIRLWFVVPAAPVADFFWRFRLDYGENEARAAGVPAGGWDGNIAPPDGAGNLGPAVGAAQFGEVEDYHFWVVNDCNGNGIPDECETDPWTPCCGAPGLPPCRPDVNSNSLPDECEDCRGAGGPPDDLRIAWGLSQDVDGNGIPDECQIDPSLPAFFNDYNGNGIPDTADVDPSDPDGNGLVSADCDGNGVPDEIEDCDGSGIGDACEIAGDPSLDCNQDGVLNVCEPDCNGNGTPDPCEAYDCNANGIPDDCDVNPADPDGNGLVSADCNANGLPDECEDCNANGVADECDVAWGASLDCNGNGYPDECEFDPIDCNGNGVPDECDIVIGTSADCNRNYVPDECDLASGTSPDCNNNNVPDECDLAGGTSPDCNSNGVPDECDVLYQLAFAAPVNYPTDWADRDVVAADLNGDGVLDLVVSGELSGYVMVLIGNGDGTFGTATNYAVAPPMSPNLYGLAAADLDGDGDLDLAVTDSKTAGLVWILANDGAGAFMTIGALAVGDHPYRLVAADLDGDTDVDLAVTSILSDDVAVFLNTGGWPFPPAVFYPVAPGAGPLAITAADLDSDLDLDLAVANRFGNNVSVFLNNGTGTLAPAVSYATGSGPFSIVAADLDDDGDADLATGNYDSPGTSVLLNSGSGTYSAPASYAYIGDWSIAAADLDHDGDVDLIGVVNAPANTNNVRVLRNNGDGTFADTTANFPAGFTYQSLAIGDFDNDDDTDVAVTAGPGVSVLLNVSVRTSADGNGNGIPDECEIRLGDLNCDGTVGFGDINPFVLYLSNFAAWQAAYPNCPPATGDINGDGTYPSFADINPFVALLTGS